MSDPVGVGSRVASADAAREHVSAKRAAAWAEAIRFTWVFFIVNAATVLLFAVFFRQTNDGVLGPTLSFCVYVTIPLYVGTACARCAVWLLARWGRAADAPRVSRRAQLWLALMIVPPLGAAAFGSVGAGAIMLLMQFVVGAALTWLRRTGPDRTAVVAASAR